MPDTIILLLFYQSQINFLKEMKFCTSRAKILEIWCSFQNFTSGHFAPPLAIINFNDIFPNFIKTLALCPKAVPWHLDTLMKHFCKIILNLLFFAFHKLFTEKVRC